MGIVEIFPANFETQKLHDFIESQLEMGSSGNLYGTSYRDPKKDSKWRRGRTRRVLNYGISMNGTKPFDREVELIPQTLRPLAKQAEQCSGISRACDSVSMEFFDKGRWCSDIGHSSFFLPVYCIVVLKGSVKVHYARSLPTETENVPESKRSNSCKLDQISTLDDGVFEGGEEVVLEQFSLMRVDGRGSGQVPRVAVAKDGHDRIVVVLRWLTEEANQNLRPRRGPPKSIEPIPEELKASKESIPVTVPDETGKAGSEQSSSSKNPRKIPDLEKEHVQAVYDTIAPHWSRTRYKPWPKVAAFLDALPPGSLVLDAGCGNGKYMNTGPPNTARNFMVGTDLSMGLLRVCQEAEGSRELLAADSLLLPFREGLFDAGISIAVLHHISTVKRRLELFAEIHRVLKVGGEFLIYAWAFEQEPGGTGSRKFPTQDVLVPWHLSQPQNSWSPGQPVPKKPREEEKAQEEILKPHHGKFLEEKKAVVYQRFCHVYHEGELEALVAQIPGLDVIQSYFDSSNWCIIVRKGLK